MQYLRLCRRYIGNQNKMTAGVETQIVSNKGVRHMTADTQSGGSSRQFVE